MEPLPTVPPHPTELEPTPPEVKRYQRQKLTAALGNTLLSLGFLTLMALEVGPRLDASLRAWLGEGEWLRLFVVAAVVGVGLELLTLPLAFWSGYVLEHRYQLSNQTLGQWVWRTLKGYLVGGVIGLPLLFGLYALLRFTEPWWVWAAVGWLAVTLVLGRLLPVVILPLFYKVTRLEDAALEARLRHLFEGTGLAVEGVYRLHLSAETRKANAALAGLGRTRRVLLGDTLLEQFTPEEIEVVFAHEVGHHVHHHLPKMIAWSVVLSAVGFWVVDWVLRAGAERLGYTAFNDPAALPLVLLVLTLFGLALGPVQNAISRFFERQCDRYALDRTRDPRAYRAAFVKLARLNKSDPDPNPLVAWLFYDHPPIRQRLAMADG
ncbi:MAG: M48 family metalloprotease [Gemmataceae bacterium]|nr:M48 family metalloprotease [Gemmataceae bacterium]